MRRNVVQAVPDLKEPASPISLGNLLHQYQLENVVNTFAVSGKKEKKKDFKGEILFLLAVHTIKSLNCTPETSPLSCPGLEHLQKIMGRDMASCVLTSPMVYLVPSP